MLHFGGLFPQGSLCPRRQGGDVFAPLPGAHGWRKREASSWEMRKRGVLRRWECPTHLPSSKEGFSLFFFCNAMGGGSERQKEVAGGVEEHSRSGEVLDEGYGAPPACLGAAGGGGGMSQPWGLFLYVPGQGCSWQHPGASLPVLQKSSKQCLGLSFSWQKPLGYLARGCTASATLLSLN